MNDTNTLLLGTLIIETLGFLGVIISVLVKTNSRISVLETQNKSVVDEIQALRLFPDNMRNENTKQFKELSSHIDSKLEEILAEFRRVTIDVGAVQTAVSVNNAEIDNLKKNFL